MKGYGSIDYYPTDQRFGSSDSIMKGYGSIGYYPTDRNRIRDDWWIKIVESIRGDYSIDVRVTVILICRNSIRGASSTGSDSAHYSDCRDRTQVR